MTFKMAGQAACSIMMAWTMALPSVVSANKLVNPGFETPSAAGGDIAGVAGWNEFGSPGTRYLTSRTEPHGDAQCLKMFGPWAQWDGTGMTQAFPASPGQTWLARIWTRNDSSDAMQGANFCVMKVEFRDAQMNPAGGQWLAGVNVFEVRIADATSPLDVWQEFGIGTAPAPAGTAFAQFLIVEVQGNNPVLGGSVFIDDAFFEELCSQHNPVFDADDSGRVDALDFDYFTTCMTGPGIPLAASQPLECQCLDRNRDSSIDQRDFGAFQACYSGVNDVDTTCDD